MSAIDILTAAARRKCPECQGSRFQKPIPGADDVAIDCPACAGTGLWLPMLSEPCPGMPAEDVGPGPTNCKEFGPDCPMCDGTSRALLLQDGEGLDAAAEKLGCPDCWTRRSEVGVIVAYDLLPPDEDAYFGDDYCFQRATGVEARQAALAAIITAVLNETHC